MEMTEGFSIPMAKVPLADALILVCHMVAGYRKHFKKQFSKPHHVTDLKRRLAICDELDAHDSNLAVNSFRPCKLNEYRARVVKDGDKSRRYIHRLVGEIRKMFRWAIGIRGMRFLMEKRCRSADRCAGDVETSKEAGTSCNDRFLG